MYDVIVIGGGPAGLTAALILGRARKRVMLLDAPERRRNLAAETLHGFVTRDGETPDQFRAIGRAQLAAYDVEIAGPAVEIVPEGARFAVRTADRQLAAERVVLALGMIDVLPELPGFRELWGTHAMQCPYCHGWEVRDQRFAVIGPPEQAIFLRGWSRDIIAFLPDANAATADDLARAGVVLERRPVVALRSDPGAPATVVLGDGSAIPRDALWARPAQRQTALVQALGLALDDQGYVDVGPTGETSIVGLYAAGDLTTMRQSAQIAASAGALVAYNLNHELTLAQLRASGSPSAARSS